MVMKFVKKHEIKDFHLEENEAFTQVKIKYNDKTILTGDQFVYDDLSKEIKARIHKD